MTCIASGTVASAVDVRYYGQSCALSSQEAALQQLRLEELLRYAFSGALGMIAVFLTHPTLQVFSSSRSIAEATLVIGLVLLAGSLIYTLHRAVVYPILYRTALLILAACRAFPFSWELLVPYRQARIELEMDLWRLKLRREEDAMHGQLAEWGAQVHFLYCSALAILLALYLSRFVPGPPDAGATRILVWFSALLTGSAMVHHLRLIYMISRVWKR
jgi:uncharacterized membrane protein YgdD (TMEM256/DUF423 family)